MTGSTRSSADLDPRRRRALFRAWHRGMREMDLVLGRFADEEIGGLSDSELDEFEVLLDVPDTELFKWLTGESTAPAKARTPLFDRVRKVRTAATL
jgi:antitoxin CptB